MTTRITEQQDFVPGILYALFERGEDRNDDSYDRQVALAYWTGRGFADHDSDFEDLDWDWAVAQNVDPNPEFIEAGATDTGYESGRSFAAGYRD